VAYSSNILTNPGAETQDISGWIVTPHSSISIIENQTTETRYIPFPDDRDKWLDETHILTLVGNAGDYCFRFLPTAQMEQIMYASDIGVQPVSFQLIGKYKLEQPQNAWDTSVLASISLTIYYTDGTKDYFIIPCIKGATHADRSLINFWILVYAVCTVDADKTLDYVKVIAKTVDCSQILNIDYIELRKEV
jgi:hypothetical protein